MKMYFMACVFAIGASLVLINACLLAANAHRPLSISMLAPVTQ